MGYLTFGKSSTSTLQNYIRSTSNTPDFKYFAFLPKELLNTNMMEPMLFMKRKKLPKMILPDFVKKLKKMPTFGDSNMNKMELPKLKNLSTPN